MIGTLELELSICEINTRIAYLMAEVSLTDLAVERSKYEDIKYNKGKSE